MKVTMKILFLIPYPLEEAPSQRFRFEQYFSSLKSAGNTLVVQSFLNSKNGRIFFSPGKKLKKITAIVAGFVKRFLILFQISSHDYIFVHREITPVGPPVFEWIICKVLRKKIIYDFDDSIWLTDKNNESRIERIIRWRDKVKLICEWSYKVSAGNEYLCAYAKKFNKRTVHNPTTINTETVHNQDFYRAISDASMKKNIVIGWTGSHSTLKYLLDIEQVLQELEVQFPQLEFWIIADRPSQLKLTRIFFKSWTIETEISDLAQIDIGIMPLPDDEWAKGKCGFKALQYMSLNIPSVVSPVGVNKNIIDHGINGFLASTQEEWKVALIQLIENVDLRKRMGDEARKKIIASYSVVTNTPVFLGLFK
jgi:glycosyltransferase involved in cell wall biosynthesis